MSDYKRIPTTYDVWKAIKAAHPCLKVFATFSDPEHGRMETSYGFPGHDTPIMEARTTWDIECKYTDTLPIIPINKRINEEHQYWLCFPLPQTETINQYDELLTEAARLFRKYEESHRSRGTEHQEKADVNADIAQRIENAIYS